MILEPRTRTDHKNKYDTYGHAYDNYLNDKESSEGYQLRESERIASKIDFFNRIAKIKKSR